MRRRDRKGRVLHTRVPEVLETELKRLADSLSVPVSNIVRAVLEDALDVAESMEHEVERDMRDAAERIGEWRERRERRRRRWQDRADRSEVRVHVVQEADSERNDPAHEAGAGAAPEPNDATPDLPPEVVGVQPMRMARDGACLVCSKPLGRGADAFLGVGPTSGPPVVLCPTCAP